jgi:ferredoxin
LTSSSITANSIAAKSMTSQGLTPPAIAAEPNTAEAIAAEPIAAEAIAAEAIAADGLADDGNGSQGPPGDGPAPSFPITVHWREQGKVIHHQVPAGEYILRSFEQQGDPLPFSCRQGCCTACAVRVLQGSIDQRESLGLSQALRDQGYGLLCVARATGPLVVETQAEDEVYELQFGRFFGRGKVRSGLPLEEE